ncbi:MAG: hypothetical protein U5R49_00750 [Deltaproteobacteria bacterium]|nr:hypothetical protein [Deltaproteobacteria bacterium]
MSRPWSSKTWPCFRCFSAKRGNCPTRTFSGIREEKRKFTQVVEQIIEEGVAIGCFRRLNPKLMAYAIIGMCNWLYRWYKTGAGPFSPDEIADQFIALLENGYRAEEGKQGLETADAPGQPGQSGVVERKRDLFDELKQGSDQISTLIRELEMLI